MRLSISNIAWPAEWDARAYARMGELGYEGLEIAPTRIFPDAPYERLFEAAKWRRGLFEAHGFCVPSMQSIWRGRGENLFGTDAERAALLSYTKKAIDFAEAISCKNLVFGCPRNRVLGDGADPRVAIPFFREIGDYAAKRGAVIGMEANPASCGTNYVNDTAAALELVGEVDSPGFRLNLDTGTMVANGEGASVIEGKVYLISHVHFSEPGLAPLRERPLHGEVAAVLQGEGYGGFVSAEMGSVDDFSVLEGAMEYLAGVAAR